MKRKVSPLCVVSDLEVDESSLDSDIRHVSTTRSLHDSAFSDTLLIGTSSSISPNSPNFLRSTIQGNHRSSYHPWLESVPSRSSASTICISPTTPPPLPPRTLLSSDRTLEHSEALEHEARTSCSEEQRDGSEDKVAVCSSCGRKVTGQHVMLALCIIMYSGKVIE